jgi:hypothetical protein
MHRAAYHFIKALGIPTLTKTKHKTSKGSAGTENTKANIDDREALNDGEEEEDEADIDTSLEIVRLMPLLMTWKPWRPRWLSISNQGTPWAS